MSTERERRAALRSTWTGGLVERGSPAQLATPEERLSTMWALALDAWALQPEPLPTYRRQDAPGRLIRPR